VIGKILRSIEEAQLDGKLSNREEALEWVQRKRASWAADPRR